MSSVSKCPRCRQQVTIPEGVAAEMQVRCPLCSAEYALGEALAAIPPALILVGLVPSPAVLPQAVATGAGVSEGVAVAVAGGPNVAAAAAGAEEAVETLADYEMEMVTGPAIAPVAESTGQPLVAPVAERAGTPAVALPIPIVTLAASPAAQTGPVASTPAAAASTALHPWEKIPDDSLDHEAEEHAKGDTAAEEDVAIDAAVFGGPSKPMAVSAGAAPKREENAAAGTTPAIPAKRRPSSLSRLTPAQRLKFRVLGMAIAGLIGLFLAWLILRFIFGIR